MIEETLSKALKDAVEVIARRAVGSQAEVDHLEKWGIGALNDTYYVRTVHPAAKLFLKVEKERIFPSVRRGQVEREVYGAEMARAAGIDCPTVLQYDFSKEEVGFRYVLSEFIDAELMWEVKDALTEQEREGIREDIVVILDKLATIPSKVFGDIYSSRVIGQFATWRDAYRRQWEMLLCDGEELGAFSAEQRRVVAQAGACAVERIGTGQRPTFSHGDLGLHNLLVDRSTGAVRIGKVIDFGNATFTPRYLDDDGLRRHGGFGLAVLDEATYGVSPEEFATGNLLNHFGWAIFASMLKQVYGHDRGDQVGPFVEACQKVMG